MTDDVAVHEAIATALAERREPDLSPFEPVQVLAAMERALLDPTDREHFFAWLNRRVELLSGGRIRLEKLPSDGQPCEDPGTSPRGGAVLVPDLALRVVVAGEPFSERAVVRCEDPVLQYPMRA